MGLKKALHRFKGMRVAQAARLLPLALANYSPPSQDYNRVMWATITRPVIFTLVCFRGIFRTFSRNKLCRNYDAFFLKLGCFFYSLTFIVLLDILTIDKKKSKPWSDFILYKRPVPTSDGCNFILKILESFEMFEACGNLYLFI